ncbi:ArsR/SmtB family transcription factor [Halobacterium hubeiense]|uniref:ArsR/SmtB family transcription factor n=2 Tax=Halobacterium hubeiense TaxID=1407499 RepID=UPI000B7E1CFA|nr:winged helix-turn-helix domain-containing protein [Halobacterium hubeiense]
MKPMTSIRELAQNERPPDEDGTLRIVDMNDEQAVSLFKTLGDETTLKIYTAIQQEPKTPPELQELTETTLQNTHYHMNKLEDADLIEPVDTWVSDRGKDMNVYGPTNSPLLISFAAERDTPGIRSRILSVLGMVGVVSLVSLFVEYAVDLLVEPASQWQQVGAGGYGEQESLTAIFLQYPGLCVFAFGLLGIFAYLIFVSSTGVKTFKS